MNTANTIIDIDNPDFIQNPYPYYAEMRNSNRPVWAPLNEDYESNGIWLFGSYADALTIFKQTSTVTKYFRTQKTLGSHTPFDLHLLNRDGADHMRLRRSVAEFFSASAVKAFEARIDAVADSLINGFRNEEPVDLIADYALPLPLQVIAEMMGIPRSDLGMIRKWARTIMVDSLKLSDEIKQQRQASLAEFTDYLTRLIAEGRFGNRHGLIAHLLIHQGNATISRDELIGMIIFLLVAGHETTIDLIGNGLWLLLSHPAQLQSLQQKPESIPRAVEEILRYESPAQRSTFRMANSKIELPNGVVEPGQQVAVFIGSANRDDKIFARPDTFDVQRDPNPHLAFGTGVHNCLGKTLARVEARIAIARIMGRLSRAALLQTSPTWKNSSMFRGLTSLMVSFNSAA